MLRYKLVATFWRRFWQKRPRFRQAPAGPASALSQSAEVGAPPPAWKEWSAWIVERMETLAPHARRVLEVGGEGRELAPFLRGREFHALNFPAADICRRTAFPDGHFDAVLSKMTFEHLYDPFGAAAEITRLLAPDGLLILITVWAWRYHTAPGIEDYWRFSPAALRQLFPRLEVLDCGYDLTGRRVDCRMDQVPVDDLGGWREHWAVYLVAKKPSLYDHGAPAVSRPFQLAVFDFSLDQILDYGQQIARSAEAGPAVEKVMELKPEAVLPLLSDGERGLPSEPRFSSTGYSRMMLARYLVPGALLCRGLDVLDTCCGLGWGSFLLSRFAASVTAFDRERAVVDFARGHWPAANICWESGDALDPDFLSGRHFDAVLAMETIEHFTRADVDRYLAWITSRLKTGGLLVGTSAFPKTRAEADCMAAENPHHHYIFTEEEFLALLRQYSSRAAIIGGWMFLAIR